MKRCLGFSKLSKFFNAIAQEMNQARPNSNPIKTSYPQRLCFRHGVMMIIPIKRVSLSRRVQIHTPALLSAITVTRKSNKLDF